MKAKITAMSGIYPAAANYCYRVAYRSGAFILKTYTNPGDCPRLSWQSSSSYYCWTTSDNFATHR